jgi:hypothetical protein
MQTAVRQYTVKWRSGSGWSKTNDGWTGPFYLYTHYTQVENYGNFSNPIFCQVITGGQVIGVTLSNYPHVRMLLYDDGAATFFDDASSSGVCSDLLHKEWLWQYQSY